MSGRVRDEYLKQAIGSFVFNNSLVSVRVETAQRLTVRRVRQPNGVSVVFLTLDKEMTPIVTVALGSRGRRIVVSERVLRKHELDSARQHPPGGAELRPRTWVAEAFVGIAIVEGAGLRKQDITRASNSVADF